MSSDDPGSWSLRSTFLGLSVILMVFCFGLTCSLNPLHSINSATRVMVMATAVHRACTPIIPWNSSCRAYGIRSGVRAIC
ncbi:hypothetical protein BDV29DRAFT_176828 [Aspergillus leporis]|uniref:Uncharacterized protein n=1 Tax=Aspergillus leporis TaxID=41062 RepID=A0A5N5X051_9EURO|nr:hypothetical protein BDV29DRAFT_176828 [Aspergillus leporis]